MQVYLCLHNPVCPLHPPEAAPGVPSPVDTRNCSLGFTIEKGLVSSLKSNHAIAVCSIKSNAKTRSWSQPTVGHISKVSTATSPCSFSPCSALPEGKTLPPLFAPAEGLYIKYLFLTAKASLGLILPVHSCKPSCWKQLFVRINQGRFRPVLKETQNLLVPPHLIPLHGIPQLPTPNLSDNIPQKYI